LATSIEFGKGALIRSLGVIDQFNSMKEILFFLICFIKVSGMYSQSTFINDMKYGDNILADDSSIFVSGHNFREDGWGRISILYRFDHDLKENWKVTLDSAHTNTIDEIKLWKENIIITGIYGKKTGEIEDAERYIKILNLKGDVIFETNLGMSTSITTNLLIINNTLYLGYKKSSSIYYSERLTTSTNAVVELDLNSKKFSIMTHDLIDSDPQIIVSDNSNIFIAGECRNAKKSYNPEVFFHKVKNDKSPILNIIPADKLEGLAEIIYKKNQFVVLSYSNPYVKNQEPYLRFDNLNKSGTLIKTSTKSFSDYGWDWISSYFPDVENDFWVLIRKKDQFFYFVKLDSDGTVLFEVKATINNASSYDFVIIKNKIVHLMSEGVGNKTKVQIEPFR
jgi:hypothetical protein